MSRSAPARLPGYLSRTADPVLDVVANLDEHARHPSGKRRLHYGARILVECDLSNSLFKVRERNKFDIDDADLVQLSVVTRTNVRVLGRRSRGRHRRGVRPAAGKEDAE